MNSDKSCMLYNHLLGQKQAHIGKKYPRFDNEANKNTFKNI